MPYNLAMHILVKFSLLLVLASLLSRVSFNALILLSMLTMVVACMVCTHTLLKMLRRVKWLLIILSVMYAFTTPGQYLRLDFTALATHLQALNFLIPNFELPNFLVPSYEGISAGIKQTLNIVTMLAGLALIMSTTPTPRLIAGLYQLILPLRRLGFDAQTFAVRLWLTLYYVESQHAAPIKGRRLMMTQAILQVDSLNVEVSQNTALLNQVTLQLLPINQLDKLILFISFASVMTIWLM